MENIQQRTLRELGVRIERELSFDSHLLTMLHGKRIITELELEAIQAKTRPVKKIQRFVGIFKKKVRETNDVFEQFCQALEQDEQVDLAQCLRLKLEELRIQETSPGPSRHNSDSVRPQRKALTARGVKRKRSAAEKEEEEERVIKKRLLQNRVYLVCNISVNTGLFNYLRLEEVLDKRVEAELKHDATDHTIVERLLDYLQKQPLWKLEKFLEALRNIGDGHIADRIEFGKLMHAKHC